MQCPPEKRQRQTQKMNRYVSIHCSILLKSLMGHSKCWPFIEPVDPMRWNVTDHFSMISKPMDLGTVKSNLEKSLYVDIDEFAADIRLTFSNAILYNPPHNYVHKLAVEMSELFEKRWKFLEEKWNHQFGSEVLLSKQSNRSCDVKQNDHKSSLLGAVLPKRSKISYEETVGTSSSNSKTAQGSYSFWEVKVAKSVEKSAHTKPFHKGTDGVGRHTCGSISTKPLIHKTDADYDPCDSDSLTVSDISSERSAGIDHYSWSTHASKQDWKEKNSSEMHISRSETSNDGETLAHDPSMSPSKALRAAIIKHPFADTILKAQEKKLLAKCDKADPAVLRQEKERLEKWQRKGDLSNLTFILTIFGVEF